MTRNVNITHRRRSLFILPECILIAAIGGVTYFTLEVLWRGWSHISMAFCGAICFTCIYYAQCNPRIRSLPLPYRALGSALFITTVEFIAGCIVNLWLDLDIWNYVAMPLDLLGQICIPMSALWFLLSFPAIIISDFCRRFIFAR